MPLGAEEGRSKPWITSPYGLKASTVSGRAGMLGGDAEVRFGEAVRGWPKIRSRFKPPSGKSAQSKTWYIPGNVLSLTCEKI